MLNRLLIRDVSDLVELLQEKIHPGAAEMIKGLDLNFQG